MPAASSLMAASVGDKCVDVLKQLKGITATYRMTNKPLPTRHSHFVPSILAPLKAFSEGDKARLLSDTVRLELVRAVVDTVNARYDEMARDLSVRKTESSLARLKNRQGAGAKGAELSDTDKIVKQITIDVQEHGRQIMAVGIIPNELESFRRLTAASGAEEA
mmetsp:Transcript_18590/g.60608  ORF Transcript_18590/g.60608 Transcript_18590/m.60608 type:complete len:163 (+) Transcript_18590:883-1371(+)